ncbi:DUF2913 family protein [Citrobacter koseri]|uniref:DUF2913 family protein n=1 Tax=Citrobacter koseri TaxID=545 RepID=UPI002941F3DF|nr:DUF2913 family protein [Citrobacter koseri]MEB2704044.1 DUF2913 family protein [Citrobacter koseri]MEB2709575.1 DUF2913 family protein [Citrobacter koseri]WOJ30414.1 DUF2913 family protein [Citrobacter koseri]WOJ34588.1 DUF2913 family protein [Citrobacter koseri]
MKENNKDGPLLFWAVRVFRPVLVRYNSFVTLPELNMMSSEKNKNILSHFIFCALTALHLARKDGIMPSSQAENIFLVRWLIQAQKQKRFPKSVAKDIEFFIKTGQKKNKHVSLRRILEKLWNEENPHTLMRLTQAVESLISSGWENATLTRNEWDARELQPENSGSAFFVSKSALTESFSETGDLINPVDFLVYGNVKLFIDVFRTYQLKTEKQPSAKVTAVPQIVRLTP